MFAAAALLLIQVTAPLQGASRASSSGYVGDGAQVVRPDAASSISGTIRDSAGGVISGASIVIRNGERDQYVVSGPDGRFSVPAPPAGEVLLLVRAAGFAELRYTIAAGTPRTNVDLVVVPASVTEAVTVTATRGERRSGDVPASVSLLDRQEIKQSPALVADDVLRQIPTFSLFRRTSSLASHPTAQGVSLRGIGPSGDSRTLVLVDGVPVNDPFGGWVYWSRVPLESTDRIEVVDGSSSSLYGNYAMGGVINFVTSPATPKTLDVKAQYGSRNTPKVDFVGSHVWGKAGVTVDGNVFDTDGYAIVRASERGQQRCRAFLESQRKAGLRPHRSDPGVRARGLLQRKPRQRQGEHDRWRGGRQRHDVARGQRGRAGPDARPKRTAGDLVHQCRDISQQFSRVAPHDTGTQHRPHDVDTDRTHDERGRHGAVVARARIEAVFHCRH